MSQFIIVNFAEVTNWVLESPHFEKHTFFPYTFLFNFLYEKLNFQHESKQMKLNDRVFLRVSLKACLFPTQSFPLFPVNPCCFSIGSGPLLKLSHTSSTCPHFPVHSCNPLFFSVHPTPPQMKLSVFFFNVF